MCVLWRCGFCPCLRITLGLRFAWQSGPCFSYAKREVLRLNDILQELLVFLSKRVKWFKLSFHGTQVIYTLYPGADHPQGPNCWPTLLLAPVESMSQATKRRKREKGPDSTAAVRSRAVQHYGTPARPTEYVENSDDKGSIGRPIQIQ